MYLESSKIKSDKAVDLLTWFSNLGKIRDVAAIATVTTENYMYLPSMVRKMTPLNIWTFYDLYHYDRGQPGSKTSEYNPNFAFTSLTDGKKLLIFLQMVDDLKKRGFLVHTRW